MRYKVARIFYQQDRENSMNTSLKDTEYFSLDLQKVRMLPEMPGVKTTIFTPRIVAYNETFSPIGVKCGPSTAVIWHQGVAGRKDEDICSAFVKFIKTKRDVKNLVFWLDNCSAQNKNWTLYCALIKLLNAGAIACESVTLKYFEKGHTFMSADSFHAQVEKAAKAAHNIYDYNDYINIIEKCGVALLMNEDDFKDYQKELGFSHRNLASRPLFENVVEAKFVKGQLAFLWKKAFRDQEWNTADILIGRAKENLSEPRCSLYAGINQARKQEIVDKLCPLMPASSSWRLFWQSL